jgi:hypothetical protein
MRDGTQRVEEVPNDLSAGSECIGWRDGRHDRFCQVVRVKLWIGPSPLICAGAHFGAGWPCVRPSCGACQPVSDLTQLSAAPASVAPVIP